MQTNGKYLSNGEIFDVLFKSMNEAEDKDLLADEKSTLEYLLNLPYEDIEKFFTDNDYYDQFVKDESKAVTTNSLKMFGCFVLNGYLLGHKHGQEDVIDEMIALSESEDKNHISEI